MKAVVTIEVENGDIVVAQTNIPGIQHFGVVVLGSNSVDVIHITPSNNVRRESIQEFLKTRTYMQLRRTGASVANILARYDSMQHAEYDVDELNCIQFAEYLTQTV